MTNVLKGLIGTLLTLLTFMASAQVQLMEDASGLKYKIVDDQPGKSAELGKLVSLHMVAKSSTGETIKNSYVEKGGKQVLFPIKVPTYSGDLYYAVSLLSKGDSAVFALNADSLYLKTFKKPRPANVAAGSDVIFTIKVFEIYDQKAYRDSLIAKQKGGYDEKRAEDEDDVIKNYLLQNDLEATKTESGLYIMSSDPNAKGKLAKDGETVAMQYECKLLDGTVVESTYEMGKLFSFVVGSNSIVPGWEEGVKLTPVGSMSKLIIPSRLAYRHLQKGQIKPHSIIIIEVEIISIR